MNSKVLLQQAKKCYLHGQCLEAVKIQTKAINELAKENKSNFDEIHHLCLYLIGVGDFKSALQLLQYLKKKKLPILKFYII
jgi:hypothetical protein